MAMLYEESYTSSEYEDEEEFPPASEEEARRELAAIIRCHDEDEMGESIGSEEANEVLELCEAYEILATEYFFTYQGKRVMPFEFLITYRASLEVVRRFVEHCPKVLEKHNLSGMYPLHCACAPTTKQPPVPGVIPFLARKFPLAAAKEDWHHKRWPIEWLIGHSNDSAGAFEYQRWPIEWIIQEDADKADIEALFLANPPGNICKQRRLLEAAIWCACRPHILECIIDQCVLIKSLSLIAHHRDKKFTDKSARALSRVLPQLNELEINIYYKRLTPGGWENLMESVGTSISLQHLRLSVPVDRSQRRVPSNNNDASEPLSPVAMNLAIASIPNLKTLELTGSIRGRTKWNEGVTEALVSLLERNTLEVLTAVYFSLDHEAIFETLRQNTSLGEFDVRCCVDSEEKRTLLADLLQNNNTSLHQIHLSSRGGGAKIYDKISYLTLLNRYGRGKARNVATSRTQFVDLLKAIPKTIDDNDNSAKPPTTEELSRIQCIYGLLRECPTIWC